MVSLGEGNTPILSLTSVAQALGLNEVFGKAEWMNPTGSYKDRIAAATITRMDRYLIGQWWCVDVGLRGQGRTSRLPVHRR